jgi:hypothetical protein
MTTRHNLLAVRIISIFAVAGVLGALSWELLRPRIPDPIYEGKPLSYWLSGKKSTWDMAEEAVRHAGTNSIPMLLQMMRADDSPLKRKWNAFTQRRDLLWCSFEPAELRHHQAVDGFRTLGPLASNAVPRLMKIYESNVSVDSQVVVLMTLRDLGPESEESVPLLLSARTNANSELRMFAVMALGWMQVQADRIVPALVASLDDPDPYVRQMAVSSLGKTGPDASAAVPRLLTVYSNTPPDAKVTTDDPVITRDLIGSALNKIDPAAAARVGWQMTNASQ